MKSRINIKLGDEMKITQGNLNDLPEKQYLIRRLEWAEGYIGILCGTGHSGKTMLAQYLALCISTGNKPFGTWDVNKGKVLHIDQEQHEDMTKARYFRLAKGMGIDKFDIDRMYLNKKLDDPALDQTQIAEVLTEKLKGYSFCIIDSLKKVSAADENSSQIEGVLSTLLNVARKSGCFILLIHHKGKTNNGAQQSGRGHSSIYDSVDIQIDLDHEINDPDWRVFCKKNRAGSPFKGFEYVLSDGPVWNERQNCWDELKLTLEGEAEAPLTKAKEIDEILSIIRDNPNVNNTGLKNAVKNRKLSIGKDRLAAMLEKLVSTNRVIAVEAGKNNAILYSINKDNDFHVVDVNKEPLAVCRIVPVISDDDDDIFPEND
jgi:hypothetical protein